MNFTDEEILDFVIQFESELFSKERISFNRNKSWTRNNFPDGPGIYAIFDKRDLIYIGESANIRLRMQEIKRTYNHSIKKILNKKYFKQSLIGNKYCDDTEAKIDHHLLEHITFSALPLNFGRLEMESYLLHRNAKKVLNKIGKRNRIPDNLIK